MQISIKSSLFSHVVLFEDALESVKQSKVCELNGTDKIVMGTKFEKDFGKLRYIQRFFRCNHCKCAGKCMNVAVSIYNHFDLSCHYVLLVSYLVLGQLLIEI